VEKPATLRAHQQQTSIPILSQLSHSLPSLVEELFSPSISFHIISFFVGRITLLFELTFLINSIFAGRRTPIITQAYPFYLAMAQPNNGTINNNLTWAQRIHLTLQNTAQPANHPRIILGNLPNELQDMIFQYLLSRQLHPFLFSSLTYRSAHRALYRTVFRLTPSGTASRNIFETIAVLQDNDEVLQMSELEMEFPRDRVPGGFMPTTSWGEAVNAVLWQWDHWTNMTLELGSGNMVARAGWTAFRNLTRMELIGRRDNDLCDHAWAGLQTTNMYELVLRSTMLRQGPASDQPYITDRIRTLTIHLPRWRTDITTTLWTTRFNGLEELSLELDEHLTVTTGFGLAGFLDPLSHSGGSLRCLSLRGAFLRPQAWLGGNGQRPSPLRSFRALEQIELPLAHLCWVHDMLSAPEVENITFGVYDRMGRYIDMLAHLSACLCQHAFTAAPNAIERTVAFRLETILPAPVRCVPPRGYRDVFSHILDLQDRLRHAAFRQGQSVEYSNGTMQLRVGVITVFLEELYMLGHWQTKVVGYRVEEAFSDFWGMIES
jgi:hypothetical protein